MITTALEALAAWFVASIPIGIAVGRLLRGHR